MSVASGPTASRSSRSTQFVRAAWRGFTEDHFEQIIGMARHETGVPVSPGRAVLVGTDGVVRDDSWVDVFMHASGSIALVQASGPDYPWALTEALSFPRRGRRHGRDRRGDKRRTRHLQRRLRRRGSALRPHGSCRIGTDTTRSWTATGMAPVAVSQTSRRWAVTLTNGQWRAGTAFMIIRKLSKFRAAPAGFDRYG
jgi:hypothetical protein